ECNLALGMGYGGGVWRISPGCVVIVDGKSVPPNLYGRISMANISHAQGLVHLQACGRSCNHPLSAAQSNNALRRETKLQRAPLITRIRALKNTSSDVSLPAMTMTLYDVLCVPHGAELGEVKKAYREKVRVYHPDVCPPGEREESCKMFLQVQEAYETLSDPILRADCDFNLHFNPHIMLLQKRNGGARDERKQQWAEQLQSLNMRSSNSGMERDSWGARMRRFKKGGDFHDDRA
ncbi:hypothetical protein KI387_006741, partial [Taxus chinensis]